ncbi:RNA polymerase sigma factor [Parapedobacter lycopersici]|uniref:RNA polymerase sigma factor n=1 Tax=Parapedobacter lycopersici TaxID=1864939 RepID=UPI003341B4B2
MKYDFQQILDEYNHQIYRTCRGFTGNDDDAKDLFQEVCINIWSGLASFKGNSKMSTWIYRVTLNTCLFFRRSGLKQLKLAEYEADIQLTYQHENNPIDHQIELLFNFIYELKDQERAVILLYLEQLSYADISEVTGLSVNHIGVKINRIKKNLASKFNKNGQLTINMD